MLTMAELSPSPSDALPLKSERSPGSPRQQADSLCQRRSSKTRSRPSPYKNNARSPGGSTCTSSDESNPEQETNDTPNEPHYHGVKRQAANCRERKRMHTVNSAFDQLRELVPTYPSNRKLSKIDTLRLACAYIQDLVSVVHSTQGLQGSDVSCLYQQGGDGFFASSYGSNGVQIKPEIAASDFQFAQYRMPSIMASDCASSDYSASESDNRSPPYFSQSCAAAPGIGVRPPPLSRTSSDSVATRMAHASISTTHGCNAPYPSSSRPLNCSMPSPLATHSVQHSASSPPPLLPSAAQVSPPVWQRAASVPYTLYGQ